MACNAPPGVYRCLIQVPKNRMFALKSTKCFRFFLFFSGFGFRCLLNSGWLPGQGLGASGEGVRIYPQAKMQSVRFKQNRWHGKVLISKKILRCSKFLEA